MKIISDLEEWRRARAQVQGSLGFVPTMGDLHEGHLSLVRRARAENSAVAVSLFVNPTQFNQPSDFEKYRRVPEQDAALLKEAGVGLVLSPNAKDMYPDNYAVRVEETEDSRVLEGEFRPGHFTGVLTVVLKLLLLAQATRAYFGEKDFQQLLLVRKMAAALFLPTAIVPCETVRAGDGLALSSRNVRLSPEEREKAPLLPRLLMSGLPDGEIKKQLDAAGFKTEYVATKWNRRLAAAWLGDTRLIDNVPLPNPPSP